MATAPRRTPTGGQEREDVQGQEDDGFEDCIEGNEGDEGADPPEDAALDPDAEQEPGGEEDLGFDEPAPTRAQSRLQRLANENAELRRQNADINRRLTPVSQPQFQPLQEESDDQFNARVQLLPPDERIEQRQIRFERRATARQQFENFRQGELGDKTNFDAKCAADQRYARWQDRVEAKRAELMREGQIVPREVV